MIEQNERNYMRQESTLDLPIVERLEQIKMFISQVKLLYQMGFPEPETELYDSIIDTLSEAADKLKDQEPRVLTADEMEDAVKNRDTVYVETADGKCSWALAIHGEEPPEDAPFIYTSNYSGSVFNTLNADGVTYDGNFYGMTTPDGKPHCFAWRAWTDKPTDEQMENTPWA